MLQLSTRAEGLIKMANEEQAVITSFTLYPHDQRIIEAVKQRNRNATLSTSAALRLALREYARISGLAEVLEANPAAYTKA